MSTYPTSGETPERMSEATSRRWEKKQKRNAEKFLSGPIPLSWLAKATPLPGKALAVGLSLWFWSGLTRQTAIKFCPSTWKQLNLSRLSVYRGLAQLESAGLIEVERQRGRCPLVTIKRIGVLDGRGAVCGAGK